MGSCSCPTNHNKKLFGNWIVRCGFWLSCLNMVVCHYKVARLTFHVFSCFPGVWKPGMKTNRKNRYENLLVKLPERQLWPKDLHGYEKCMKKVWKLPTLRCLEKVVLLKLWPPTGMKTLATHGYENKGQFSYSPQGMKTHQSFHTLKKCNCDLNGKIKGRIYSHTYWKY